MIFVTEHDGFIVMATDCLWLR